MKFKRMPILATLAAVLTTSIFTLALIVPSLSKTADATQTLNYNQATSNLTQSYDNNVMTSHIANSVQNEPIILDNNEVISLVKGPNENLFLKKLKPDGEIDTSFRLNHFDGTEFILDDGYVINTYFIYNKYLYIAYSNYLSYRVNLQAFYLVDGIEDPKQSRMIVISDKVISDIEGTININEKVVRQNPSNPGQIFISGYINEVEYMVMYNIYDYEFADLISTSNMVDISNQTIELPKYNYLISPLIYKNQLVAVIEDTTQRKNGINFLTYYINGNGKLLNRGSLINKFADWTTGDVDFIPYAYFKSIIIPSNGSTYYAILYIKDKYVNSSWQHQGESTAIVLKLDADNYYVLDATNKNINDNVDFMNDRSGTNQISFFYDTMKIDNKEEPVVIFDTPSSTTDNVFSIVLGDASSKYYNLDDVMHHKPITNLYYESNKISEKSIYNNFVQINNNNNIIYSNLETTGVKLEINNITIPRKKSNIAPLQVNPIVTNQNKSHVNLATTKPTKINTKQKPNMIKPRLNSLPLIYNPFLLSKWGLDYYDPSTSQSSVKNTLPHNVASSDIIKYCKRIFGDTDINPPSAPNYYNTTLKSGTRNEDYQYVYYTNDNAGTINVAINFYLYTQTATDPWLWDYNGFTYIIVLHGFAKKQINNKDIVHVAGVTPKNASEITNWTKDTNISSLLSKSDSEVIAYLNKNLKNIFDFISTYLPNNIDQRIPLNQIIQIDYISNITDSGTISFVYKDFSQNIETGLPNSSNLENIMTISGFQIPIKVMAPWEIAVITIVSVLGLILICSGAYEFNKRVLQSQKVVREKQKRRNERIYLQESTPDGGKRSNKTSVNSRKALDINYTKYKREDLDELESKFDDSIFGVSKHKNILTRDEAKKQDSVRTNEKTRLQNILDRKNISYERDRLSGANITWNSKSSEEEQADQVRRMQEADLSQNNLKDLTKKDYVVNKLILNEEKGKEFLYDEASEKNMKIKLEEIEVEKQIEISLQQELDELDRMEIEDFDDDSNNLDSMTEAELIAYEKELDELK